MPELEVADRRPDVVRVEERFADVDGEHSFTRHYYVFRDGKVTAAYQSVGSGRWHPAMIDAIDTRQLHEACFPQHAGRKPTIPEVLDRFRAYHPANLAWGHLHVVLDDGNVRDDSVFFCFSLAWAAQDREGIELALLLLRMSRTQRLKLGRVA